MIQSSCHASERIRRLIGLVVVIAVLPVCSATTQAEQDKTFRSQGERAAARDAAPTADHPQPVALRARRGGQVEFVPTANVVLHSEGGVAGAPPAAVFSNTIHGTGLYDAVADLSDGFTFFRVGATGWNAIRTSISN